MNDLKKILSGLSKTKMSDQKKEMIFSELLSLLGSGLDFSNSFRLLIEGEKDDKQKTILTQLYKDVVSGQSLWQALKSSGKFTALDYGVIRIGEETGKLTEGLDFLTDYYNKKSAQSRMVRSAVSYPIVILCVALLVVIFMMTVIVPMFEQVYARMGGELPTLTQWIIAISKRMPVVTTIGTLIVLIGLTFYLLFRETEVVRRIEASILLRIPVVGDIVAKNHQAHFCKLLYLLTSSGIPLLSGIEMLQSIMTFYPYQKSFETITAGLKKGQLLSSGLNDYPALYGRKLVILLRVGEETNRLPQMLRKQGEELTKDLEYKLKQLGNMLEPLLILFVGVLVAVILISMYMPMFKLGSIMG